MAIITQQAVLEDLDNMIFLLDQLIKICKSNLDTDVKTTDALNRLIMDCYTGFHPDQTTSPRSDRFSMYSKLSVNLETTLNKYADSKKNFDKTVGNLSELIKNLENIKLTLQK